MSESFIERLSRFTPDAGGLDRDALLFAAGRESARPNRPWIALAAVLAVAQPLSLVMLWSDSAPPAARLPVQVVYLPAPSADVASRTRDLSECPGLWSARHTLMESEAVDNTEPAHAVMFIESGPPLRAFAPPPPSILN